MKKLLAMLLALAMLLSMTACGGAKEPASSAAASESTAAPSSQAAEAARTEELKIALACQGDLGYGDAVGDFFKAFSAHIEEGSNGMIKFETFPSGQLGSENDMLDQVLSGTLDGAFLSVNVLATVWTDLYMFSLPFAFASEDDYWEMFEDNDFRAAVEKTVEANGLVKFVGPVNAYFRGLQNTKAPISSLKDMSGLKLRVMSGEIYSDIYQALGCSTSTISMGELYTALQQGTVEAEDMNFTMFTFLKYYESEKYMTELNAMVASNPLIISMDVWNQLSDSEKELFNEAYKLGEEASKKAFIDYKNSFYDDLKEQGVNIIMRNELSDEAVKEFQDATAGVWEKYEAKVNNDFCNIFLATRDKVFG